MPPPPSDSLRKEPTVGQASSHTQMLSQLRHVGLTHEQAQRVLALSRQIVEKAVAQMVPQLAEILLKEEHAKTMKKGASPSS